MTHAVSCPAILIAAPASGQGKTTITSALARLHGHGNVCLCAEGGGVWAVNNKLRDVELIGLGRIEGPEDVILDRDNHLYAGSRHGDIMRFLAPDYQQMEVFAHIGGTPLGMAFDRDFNLNVCVGGMGLYRVTPEREVQRVTDETNRSWASINDDSRLRLADDLDIADDGRIFFSEATVRYEMHEWPVDGLEARGNGRIVCFDPRDGSTRTGVPRASGKGQAAMTATRSGTVIPSRPFVTSSARV